MCCVTVHDRKLPRFVLLAQAALAVVALGALARPAVAQRSAPVLRVHGTATVDAHAARDHDRLVVDGRVLDDGAQPVQTSVRIRLTADAGAPGPVHPTTCSAGAKPVTIDGTDAKTDTDEGGRFCIAFDAKDGKLHLDVTAVATDLVDAGTRTLEADLAKRSLRLRFDPEPRNVALDGGPLHLEAVVTRDEELPGSPPWVAGVPLTLSTESGLAFARATSGPGGRASFDLERSKLGQPGFGELRLLFSGDVDTMPSEHRAPIRRDARVTLSLAESVAPAVPEDGIALAILASTVAGPPSSGSLDAHVGDVAVGAAPLAGPRTPLTVTFSSEETSGVYVKVKYVPDAPYYLASDDLTVAVPVRGPSPWRKAPLVVSVLAIGAWLLLGRRARRRSDASKTVVMTRPPVHDGTAGVEVKREGTAGGPWSGVVVDAHDGTPIERVRVAIEAPSFGANALASTFTDERGRFTLEASTAPPPGSRLVAEGPLHAALARPLPRGGELEIALVSRKRRVLERLVAWAKRRGPPFDQRPEPTPAQVRKAAGSSPEAAWADAVERAAFDDAPVDARVEAEVEDLAPRDGKAPEGARGEPDHRQR